MIDGLEVLIISPLAKKPFSNPPPRLLWNNMSARGYEHPLRTGQFSCGVGINKFVRLMYY